MELMPHMRDQIKSHLKKCGGYGGQKKAPYRAGIYDIMTTLGLHKEYLEILKELKEEKQHGNHI